MSTASLTPLQLYKIDRLKKIDREMPALLFKGLKNLFDYY